MTAAENDRHDRFLRLYVEHEDALRGFVRSLVPTLEDAREVMQQTAAVLWRKFDDSADFRPWAFGVAKFEALAFLRDRARDRHVFGDEVLALLEAEAMEVAQSSEHFTFILKPPTRAPREQSTRHDLERDSALRRMLMREIHAAMTALTNQSLESEPRDAPAKK